MQNIFSDVKNILVSPFSLSLQRVLSCLLHCSIFVSFIQTIFEDKCDYIYAVYMKFLTLLCKMQQL